MKVETILTPAELDMVARADLSGTACVVFDVLRATSTFVTALHHGAREIIPVREIAEAVALRNERPDILLAGERDGVKIRAAQSGGIDFDLGNSPREFTGDWISGRTIASTTTNGTRALRACIGAQTILAGTFLNLTATVEFLSKSHPAEIWLVCAGTGEKTALEDVLAAGAMAELLADRVGGVRNFSDATDVARRAYWQAKTDLPGIFASTQNARRLLAIPELSKDVAFCRQRDIFGLVAAMGKDGVIRRQPI